MATTQSAWGPGQGAQGVAPTTTSPYGTNGVTGQAGPPIPVLVPPGPGNLSPSKHMATDAPYKPTKSLLALMPVLLFLILGLSAAPLSGYYKGWAYYRQDNYRVARLGPQSFTMKVWVGYIKGSDTARQIQHRLAPARYSEYRKLEDESVAAQVVGAVECGLLCISCILVLLYFCMYVRAAGGRGSPSGIGAALFPIAALMSVILFLVTAVLYILIAIGVARISERELNDRLIPWPDWCWFLALGAAFFWGVLALFSLRESLRQRKYNNGYKHNVAASTPLAGTPAIA